ncbi:MAG: hypothetical protein NWE91_08175 [Candidatus Bathyarchaeota archaeon]|nr:hypothetical protein [Candidatus Bathyarchaeota archaeon]
MRRKSAFICGLFIVALVSLSTIKVAQAYIKRSEWQPPFVWYEYDNVFHDYDIVAYSNGSTATLRIPVLNDYHSPYMNITIVRLVFDNGFKKTLNYTANPIKVDYYDTHWFEISFTADVDKFSQYTPHEYDIRVDYNYPYTSYWSVSWSSYYPAYKFAVFTADQEDVIEAKKRYDALYQSWSSFSGVEARWLARQAAIEGSMAETHLSIWDLASANTSIWNGIDLFEQAYAADIDYLTIYQDAQLNQTMTQSEALKMQADAAMTEADASMLEANSTKVQANAAMNQSYAYLLFGLGFIIISIGVLVYAMKKP